MGVDRIDLDSSSHFREKKKSGVIWHSVSGLTYTLLYFTLLLSFLKVASVQAELWIENIDTHIVNYAYTPIKAIESLVQLVKVQNCIFFARFPKLISF